MVCLFCTFGQPRVQDIIVPIIFIIADFFSLNIFFYLIKIYKHRFHTKNKQNKIQKLYFETSFAVSCVTKLELENVKSLKLEFLLLFWVLWFAVQSSVKNLRDLCQHKSAGKKNLRKMLRELVRSHQISPLLCPLVASLAARAKWSLVLYLYKRKNYLFIVFKKY